MAKAQTKQLVVCIDNVGYPASLEKRKIYVALRDAGAEKQGLLRIIDESGEDYLYPRTLFRIVALPLAVRKAVLAAEQFLRHHPRQIWHVLSSCIGVHDHIVGKNGRGV